MPEFYVIIARTNFFPIFGRGVCAPFPTILYAPPVSYAYLYLGNMLIAKFTNIMFVPVCIVGKCPWVIDWSCSRWRHVDVIMVTWWFLCKVLLFRQCSPSDVVLSSRIVDPGYMTSLMTPSRNNLCHNFGANYVRNEARWRNGSNGQPIEKCPWTIVWACSRSRHVTQWRHTVTSWFFSVKCFFSGDVPL